MVGVEERLKALEDQMRRALATTSALQGQPADATLSIPHNDSWLFEDNVDATHAGNLRYVISANVQRVVSARLSIHLAPYRTYSNFSVTATGGESVPHTHTEAAHAHQLFTVALGGPGGANIAMTDSAGAVRFATAAAAQTPINSFNGNGTGTGNDSADHTHTVSGSSFLGITEGATAAAITIAFDGVDATANLGGPFNADAIELNVLPYLPQTKGVFHVIAMLPSGLGRIEAHLRLGVYVAAGSQF